MVQPAEDATSPEPRQTPGEELTPTREPKTAPAETACPVCDRILPLPAPDICPHCQAPIRTVNALLRTAELSLDEALRDLRTGDLDSAQQRLDFVRVTSRQHRLNVEVVQAVLDRLKGDPVSALARLRAVREKLEPEDRKLAELVDVAEQECLRDQLALASSCEHYNFALFQARRGHLEDARDYLEKALDEVPHHPQSHALLGKVLLALREEDEARYHLRRALASDPTNATAGRALSALGRPAADPFAIIRSGFRMSSAWTGSIIVIAILAVIALAALLTR
jgi:tetratricopeptide (TPR) repeat protein